MSDEIPNLPTGDIINPRYFIDLFGRLVEARGLSEITLDLSSSRAKQLAAKYQEHKDHPPVHDEVVDWEAAGDALILEFYLGQLLKEGSIKWVDATAVFFDDMIHHPTIARGLEARTIRKTGADTAFALPEENVMIALEAVYVAFRAIESELALLT